jgi:hypothetical protein
MILVAMYTQAQCSDDSDWDVYSNKMCWWFWLQRIIKPCWWFLTQRIIKPNVLMILVARYNQAQSADDSTYIQAQCAKIVITPQKPCSGLHCDDECGYYVPSHIRVNRPDRKSNFKTPTLTRNAVWNGHFLQEIFKTSVLWILGHTVAQMVEEVRYKLEGRRFDSRWCH